jgi:hypothetical protein
MEWYRVQAQHVLRKRLDVCFAKLKFLNLAYPEWTIGQMETRWGSCTPEGKILLNLKLIQVPKGYIDIEKSTDNSGNHQTALSQLTGQPITNVLDIILRSLACPISGAGGERREKLFSAVMAMAH